MSLALRSSIRGDSNALPVYHRIFAPAVQFGAFHRAADAGNLYAGLEHDDWTFGISYDLNFSDLVPASNNRGAWEISAIYIIRKRPAVPVRFKACPDQL